MSAPVEPLPAQHPVRGMLMIMVAVAMFTVLDSIAKYLARFYPVPGLVWARYAGHFLLVVLILGPRLKLDLVRTTRLPIQLLRGLLLAASSLFFFSALKFMPLAEATSINFVSPILLTLAAALFLKEKVEPARWVAIGAGFAGVLIIIRPGADVFGAAAMLPLATATCFAAYNVLTRKISGLESPYTSLFYAGLVGTVVLAAILPFAWETPTSLWHGFLVLVMGLIGGTSHLILIRAYEHASASRLAPFSYTQLLWVLIAGYLLFGDFPDAWSLTGIAIIGASAVYLATHQHLSERQQKQLLQDAPGD